MDEELRTELGRIAQDLQLKRKQVENVVELLAEGNTVPFITRYRKERTGNLDEELIRCVEQHARRSEKIIDQREAPCLLGALVRVVPGLDLDELATRDQGGDALGGLGGTLLEPLQLERVAAAVNESGMAVQFVDDPDGLIQELFDGATPGAAVITIDSLRLGSRRAEVELRLWCGALCGIFVTYEVVQVDDEWTITGPVGPIAIS